MPFCAPNVGASASMMNPITYTITTASTMETMAPTRPHTMPTRMVPMKGMVVPMRLTPMNPASAAMAASGST